MLNNKFIFHTRKKEEKKIERENSSFPSADVLGTTEMYCEFDSFTHSSLKYLNTRLPALMFCIPPLIKFKKARSD